MLDDEHHFVVVRRLAQWPLGLEKLIQAQVAGIRQATFQVGVDAWLHRALFHCYGLTGADAPLKSHAL
jgi:hypothetical protein